MAVIMNKNNIEMNNIWNKLPEELVSKITLMNYEINPHPTASMIKSLDLDDYDGHIWWYKFYLKSNYSEDIHETLERKYKHWVKLNVDEMKPNETIFKFFESQYYINMYNNILDDIESKQENIQSVMCENITNGRSNDNPDMSAIETFIQDHLYIIDDFINPDVKMCY